MDRLVNISVAANQNHALILDNSFVQTHPMLSSCTFCVVSSS